MKRVAALVLGCAVLFGALPAYAADRVVTLTLDGRPIDKHGGIAVMHGGVLYADTIDLVKTFDGLISLHKDGSATATIRGNTGAFTPGSRNATINGKVVRLPGAPFMRGGDLYVPLESFVSRIAAAKVRMTGSGAEIIVSATP
ncbi:MAG: hypothetical protein NVSMB5_24290 [Candidatus Velthaea sp.]